MVHMSYVPTSSRRPRITRTYQSVIALEIGSEVGTAARRIQRRGIGFGIAHVEDAEAAVATARRAWRGDGRVRVRRRAPHRLALRNHLVWADSGRPVHHHPGGGRRRTRWNRRLLVRAGKHRRDPGRQRRELDGQGGLLRTACPVRRVNAAITCTATPENCPSISTNQCLKVTVTYNYKSSPLFPNSPDSASSHRRRSHRPTSCRSRLRVPRSCDMHLRTGRRRGRDEKGATFILVAVSMVLLLWGGAFGVDLGLTAVGNRQVQSMADTAALDLARYVDVADWTTTIQDGATERQLPRREDGQRQH